MASWSAANLFVAASLLLAPCSGAVAASFKTIAAFSGGADGQQPYAAPIAVGGTLYGATASGGVYFQGTIFQADPTTGKTKTIYAFTSGDDGSGPNGLLSVGGMLYGTTSTGGSRNSGTLFKIDPSTGAETTLYSFTGGSDGGNSYAPLIAVGGVLYGTTENGGQYGVGTVFRFDPSTGIEAVRHSFAGFRGHRPYDGAYPLAGLVSFNGLLYGTTVGGGNTLQTFGTVYEVDPTTGREKVVHYFSGSDGYNISSSLTVAGTTLYGTVTDGGADFDGAIFAIDGNTGAYTQLYNFTGGADGAAPYRPVTVSGGTLFGTTSAGTGATSGGTLFSLDLTTGSETTLHSFTNLSRKHAGRI